tara:strand:- start:4657 stop:5328 length:672 start_codon:yes stop_codon:yes gene_type:complete
MFDNNWNDVIYANNKQVNKYPYDWVVSKVNRYFNSYHLLNEESALELGSGTGNNLGFLSEFGFGQVVGIEGSEEATDLAKNFLKQKNNIKFETYDFVSLPIENNSFIFCLDRGSITHNSISDITKTIEEVHRVLKPGGYFFSSIFSKDHYQWSKTKKHKDYTLSFEDIMGVKGGIIASFFEENDIKNLFSKFDIVEFIHEVNTWHHDKNKSTAMWNIIAQKKI